MRDDVEPERPREEVLHVGEGRREGLVHLARVAGRLLGELGRGGHGEELVADGARDLEVAAVAHRHVLLREAHGLEHLTEREAFVAEAYVARDREPLARALDAQRAVRLGEGHARGPRADARLDAQRGPLRLEEGAQREGAREILGPPACAGREVPLDHLGEAVPRGL